MELSMPRGVRPILIVVAFAVALFILMPLAAMGAHGWRMWDMHGRGQDTSRGPVVQGAVEAATIVEGFAFDPGNLEVPLGASVTWTNRDSAPHDATARDGSWRTERLSKSETQTITFEATGEYAYYCSIHPSMKARLVAR
jgi:plastocyanin